MKFFLFIFSICFTHLVFCQTNIHNVTPGESIYTIARLYGTTASHIATINKFDLLNLKLEVGQKIIIPMHYYEVKTKEEKVVFKEYIIKEGDNFYGIARDHSLAVYDIIKLNRIKGNTIPKVGTKLIIPVKTNATAQISLQEQKVNVQQGDKIEREVIFEIEMEPRAYYFVKNKPYKRAKLITDYKELPIQIFYHALIKIDTGRAKRVKREKINMTSDTVSNIEMFNENNANKEDSLSISSNTIDTNSLKNTDTIITRNILISDSPQNQTIFSKKEAAWEEFKNGVPYTAIEKVNLWLAEDSIDAEVFYLRSLCYKKVGEDNTALMDIDKAIQLNSNNPIYYEERANQYSKLKENKKAIDDLQEAEKKGMIKDELFIKIALLYELENDYPNAIINYDKEIEFNPKSGISYYFKGLIYLKLTQKKEACEAFTKAKELNFKLAGDELAKNCN